MPSFKFGRETAPLIKHLMSIGRSQDNDIALSDPLVSESHAHIQFDGQDYTLTVIDGAEDAVVNGKRKRRHRLQHDDAVQIGATTLVFSLTDRASQSIEDERSADIDREALKSYRKLFQFSERL